MKAGSEVMKLFSCSTKVSMQFIMLINVKIPTIVGILTFISKINLASDIFKQENVVIFNTVNTQ